jgi:hypothetical protein
MPSCSTDIPREFGANGGLTLQDDRDWRPGRASPEGVNPSQRFDDPRPQFVCLLFAANDRRRAVPASTKNKGAFLRYANCF